MSFSMENDPCDKENLNLITKWSIYSIMKSDTFNNENKPFNKDTDSFTKQNGPLNNGKQKSCHMY